VRSFRIGLGRDLQPNPKKYICKSNAVISPIEYALASALNLRPPQLCRRGDCFEGQDKTVGDGADQQRFR
jgi:hypothetical protein